jgi:hypothetical protein
MPSHPDPAAQPHRTPTPGPDAGGLAARMHALTQRDRGADRRVFRIELVLIAAVGMGLLAMLVAAG